MEYFLLKAVAENPIMIQGIDTGAYINSDKEAAFDSLPDLLAAYMEYGKRQEIPELLQFPMFLAGDRMKQVISLYEEQICWKGIHVYPMEEAMLEEVSPVYWFGGYTVQDCLHPDAEFYPNGMLKNLVLQRKAIRNINIFQVGGLLETRIVISLDLAESILRRNIYGAGIEEVDIRGKS